MHIALVTPGFADGDSDWFLPSLKHLTRALARRHDLQVFATAYPRRQKEYASDGARVHAFAGPAGVLPRSYRLLRAIIREHRERPFDLIHGYFANRPAVLAGIAGALCARPVLVTVMGGEMTAVPDTPYGGTHTAGGRLLTRLVRAGADTLVTLSETSRLATASHPGGAVAACPFGIDPTLFSPHGPTRDLGTGTNVLVVANFEPVKAHDDLIDAMLLIAPGTDLTLHFIGDGPGRDAAQARLADKVKAVFHGWVPHPDLPDFYRAADAVCVPSRFETEHMATLEALACGCPVYGTRVGILPEVLPDAALVAPRDTPGLARLLSGIRQRGHSAAPACPPALMLDACTNRLEALYHAVTAGARTA